MNDKTPTREGLDAIPESLLVGADNRISTGKIIEDEKKLEK